MQRIPKLTQSAVLHAFPRPPKKAPRPFFLLLLSAVCTRQGQALKFAAGPTLAYPLFPKRDRLGRIHGHANLERNEPEWRQVPLPSPSEQVKIHRDEKVARLIGIETETSWVLHE